MVLLLEEKIHVRYVTLLLILCCLPCGLYAAAGPQEAFPFVDLPVELQEKVLAVVACEDPAVFPEFCMLSQGVRREALSRLEDPEVLAQVIPPLLAQYPGWKAYILHFFAQGTTVAQLFPRMLQHHRPRWMTATVSAAKQANEPEQSFREILSIEDLLWSVHLRTTEQQLHSPLAWKKHVIATILAVAAIRSAVVSVVWSATMMAAPDVVYSAAWAGAYSAAADVVQQAAWSVAPATLWVATVETAAVAARSAAWSATYEVVRVAARLMSHSEQWGELAYRLAETVAWQVFLDPAHEALSQTYAAAQRGLEQLPPVESLDTWLGSAEQFESQIDKHLVSNRKLDATGRQLLRPFVEQLQRLSAHIFVVSEEGATSP